MTPADLDRLRTLCGLQWVADQERDDLFQDAVAALLARPRPAREWPRLIDALASRIRRFWRHARLGSPPAVAPPGVNPVEELAARHLGPNHLAVFRLTFVEGRTVADAAALLGVGPATVERARKKIRKILKSVMPDGPPGDV